MSKKIVYFDKEVFEQKIKGWIERRPYVTSKDFLLLIDGFITEIDTDQSIEERVKQYPMGDILSVYRAMTEQSLIEQMKTKEFAEWCSINGWHYSTASKGWHTPFHIHDFFTTEELFNQFTNL